MAALDFPSSPTNGQTYTANGRTWTFNGTSWVSTMSLTSGDITGALGYTPANINSPTFTGVPLAPTAAVSTNTTQIATTAFVNAEIANDATPIAHVGSGGTAHAAATTSVAGFMSAADKTKLDGIASGATANTGTVTSVSGTGTVSGLSLSGTVTTSGNITLGGTLAVTPSNFASQTAATFLAAPNAAAGTPTFRAIVAADIPTLNQNTTGSAATLTTARTIGITGDITYTSGAFNGSANVTGAATLATVNANVGTYGSTTQVPVVTVNAKGLVTGVTTATIAASGAVADGAIYENSQTISTNYTITSGKNALSAGDITIASGVTVTVPSGSKWVIV